MKFLSTFWMGVKYLWRDPVMVIVSVAFPIVIILVLGTALDSMFDPEFGANFDPPRVAVVADVDNYLSEFLEDDNVRQFLDATFTDRVHAEEMVARGYVNIAIVEQGFGQPIKILLPAQQDDLAAVALAIVDSFQQIGAAATIAAMQGRDFTHLLGVDIEITSQPLGTRIPRAVDYYAITMLVMILLYTGLNGMELFHKGIFSDTGTRMRLCPISKPVLVGGLLGASTFTSFVQGMITFTFTAVVYGVYWGERIPLVILTIFGMVLFSQALCVLLIVIFEKRNVVGGIVQVLFFVTTFVSSGFIPVNFGELNRVFRFAPNALAQTAIFGAVYGGDNASIITSLIVLLGMGGVFAALSFIVGRRRVA
ncbi:MAG: ABC transporter permease [Defluviitaleaceae bacterium]|nr:ABC transporter permease [Defluviitaleaceae bacterium]